MCTHSVFLKNAHIESISRESVMASLFPRHASNNLSYLCKIINEKHSMKPFTYILLLLITTSFFFVCGDDASVSSQLMKAEELMELAPDRQYALWCLLFTQAQDKNYGKHTSDSLIQVAVQYFEKKKDPSYLMKAYYYNATVLHELGDLYGQIGQYDSAIHYLSRSTHSSNLHTKAGAYMSLSLIEEKRQNWPMYAAYQKQYMAMRDSIDQITYTQVRS